MRHINTARHNVHIKYNTAYYEVLKYIKQKIVCAVVHYVKQTLVSVTLQVPR